MANAGDLYLGNNAGFSNQLNWRHKIIESDKQDRIDVANQIRNDFVQLGSAVGETIKDVGAPEWMGGREMKEEGDYKGLGSGRNAAKYEEMKYKVVDKEREFKLRHNEAVIKAGMINIKASKAHDLNERWYGRDPVAFEKRHAEEVNKIMESMDNYHPWQKIVAYPTYYKKGLIDKINDIKASRKAGEISEEQMTNALEAIRVTPLVFTSYAEQNKFINTKYVKTFPQATIALRNRMIDMGYLKGDLFANSYSSGVEVTGDGGADGQAGNGGAGDGGDGAPTVILPEFDDEGGDEDGGDDQGGDDVTTSSTTSSTPSKVKKKRIVGWQGRTPIYEEYEEEESPSWYEGFLSSGQSGERKKIGMVGRTPIYQKKLSPSAPNYAGTKKKSWMQKFFGRAEAAEVPSAIMPVVDTSKSPINIQLSKYEGGIDKTGGRLYTDGGQIAFPGGINVGTWAYGKPLDEKKAFARRLALQNNGKVDEDLYDNVLEFMNTPLNKHKGKYAKSSDAWKDIKISKQGMLSGIDFIRKFNLSELVRTTSWLGDPNATGRKLNQKYPQGFKDLLSEFTYRFGGGAFSRSKSLKTPQGGKLDFNKTLKSIVEAKTNEERRSALKKFKELFEETKVYSKEKGTSRIQNIIKSIEQLMREWQ